MLKKLLTLLCLCVGLAAPAQAADERVITFKLRDHNGPVTHQSYPGKYLLLSVGYTSCPDICPTTLYEYKLALQDLKNPDALQPLFVTIDPVNDEVGRLNEYTRHFDERIIGLSGELSDIQALADQLGATFGYRLNGKKLDSPKAGEPYSVYHSTLIYLIDPDHKLIDVFDYQIGGVGLAQALNKVLGDGPGKPAGANQNAAAQGAAMQPVAATTASASRTAACPLPADFQPADNPTTLHDVLPGADLQKPTLLNIWALWCAPCRTELPVLDKLAGADRNLHVQTLNLGDKPTGVEQLFAKMGLRHLPQTISQDKNLLQQLQAKGLPFTALFVGGRQVARKTGIVAHTDDISAYAKCLAGPAAARAA